jgi:hypothetical protein
MHPHHTLQLKGWLQKIEKVLIKGEQYSDEGHITPIRLDAVDLQAYISCYFVENMRTKDLQHFQSPTWKMPSLPA